jgi:hypothetical protein
MDFHAQRSWQFIAKLQRKAGTRKLAANTLAAVLPGNGDTEVLPEPMPPKPPPNMP